MPLVEFKMHGVVGFPKKRQIPEFIQGSADWYNPVDHTYVGWVSGRGDYYVPDTVVVLSKQDFVDRMLRIHAAQPMTKQPGGVPQGPDVVPETMTDSEVTAFAEQTYDFIFNHCTAEDNQV